MTRPDTLDTLARFDAQTLTALRTVENIEGAPFTYRVTDAGGIEPYSLADLLPRRLCTAGLYTAATPRDFAAYINDHGHAGTRTYLDDTDDKQPLRAVAFLDAFADTGQPGRCEHRATFAPEPSRRWALWRGFFRAGRMRQAQLAQILEDRAHDIITPDAAELREIVMTFRASRGVKVTSIVNEDTTDVLMGWETETKGAGRTQRGEVALPHALTAHFEPFPGLEPAPVLVRLAYGVDDDGLFFSMRAPRAEEILEQAVDDMIAGILDEIERGLVYRGAFTPRG